jgi:ribosomal protein S18 acetylase RimI-like enzyme
MSQCTVQFAQPEDQEHCERIDKIMGFDPAGMIHQRAIAEGRTLVAHYKDRVVGYLRYGFLWDSELPLIQMIRVVPEGQRQGVGKALISTLEQHLKRQRIFRLLSSIEETNQNSLLFHRALGFRECGTLDINLDGTQEVFVKKSLQ